VRLESEFVLLTRVRILGLQLAHFFEGEHSHFHLAQRHVSLTLPVVTLHVCWVKFDSFASIEQGELVLFELQT
jgi:hypothetical protein